MLIIWGGANGTLCLVLGRLRAGHHYDGDHHHYWSWNRPWLHLQEVSSFFSGFGERGEEGTQNQTRLLCGILPCRGREALDAKTRF